MLDATWLLGLTLSWVSARVNAADLPGRCPTSRVSWNEKGFGFDQYLAKLPKPPGDDRDALPIEVVLGGDIRSFPLPAVMFFTQRTAYYERRDPVLRKVERRIASITDPKAKAVAYRNYAMLLLYIGEFEKVISRFGPDSPDHATRYAKDPTVSFALAHASLRLGRYREAHPWAKVAYELEPNLDSRWSLMHVELGLYGRDFYEKHDATSYTVDHIRAGFPNRDWNALPFEDVTESMGIHRWGGTGSASFADLDGDGWDELISERKFFPFEIYRNRKGKRFEPVPEANLGHDNCTMIGLTGPGDVDNDGLPDLYRHCCNYDGPGPNVLLKNKGGLAFADVTERSGLKFTRGSGMIAAWADYDLDGLLDIAVGDATNTTRLYRNTGKGTFREVTRHTGTRTPPDGLAEAVFGTVGVAWGDLDDDGYPDLFIEGWGWKRLFMNNRDGTFRDVSAQAGLDQSRWIKGYTNQIFDYDNDGRLDLYAGQYVVTSDTKWGFTPICTCSNLLRKEGYTRREWSAASTIYRNNGDGTFTDMVGTLKFLPLGTMGANNGDWDNDGDQDIVMGAGGPLLPAGGALPLLREQRRRDLHQQDSVSRTLAMGQGPRRNVRRL